MQILEYTIPDDFWGTDPAVGMAYAQSLEAHVRCVREAGAMIGVDKHLLLRHDASKFTYDEFPSYAMQFHGPKPEGLLTPLANCFASAWLHHIHHNPHHWQHWIFPDGFTPKHSDVEKGVVRMPGALALEMVADWMGASMAYTGSWDMQDWLYKNMPRIRVHSETASHLRSILDALGYADVIYTQLFAGEQQNAP